MKSHCENARDEGMVRGRWREGGELKSQMGNAREDWTGEMWGSVDRGLKSQIKNARKVEIGRCGARRRRN